MNAQTVHADEVNQNQTEKTDKNVTLTKQNQSDVQGDQKNNQNVAASVQNKKDDAASTQNLQVANKSAENTTTNTQGKTSDNEKVDNSREAEQNQTVKTAELHLVSTKVAEAEPLEESKAVSEQAEDTNESDDSEPEDPMDLAKKEAKILPQIAIKGEVPELDPKGLMNGAYVYAHQIDQTSFEDGSISAKWIETPDVSKVGSVTGKAELSYKSYDDDGNEVTKTLDMDVPLEVRNGEVKKAGQVRNTVNFVDNDSNKIIFSQTWIGQSSDSEYNPNPVPALDDGSTNEVLKNSVNLLGYQDIGDTNFTEPASDLSYIDYFGKKDRTLDVLVQPSKALNGKQPVIYDEEDEKQVDNDVISPFDSAYEGAVDQNNMEPANFIFGLGQLPVGASVKWKVAPELPAKDKDGEYEKVDDRGLPILQNTPIIEIVDKNGNTIKEYKGDTLNKAIVRAYTNSQDGPLSTGKITVFQGDSVPDASTALLGIQRISGDPSTDVLVKDSPELQNLLKKDYKISWVVAPDMQTLGYQYVYYKITKNDSEDRNAAVELADESDASNQTSLSDAMDGVSGTSYNRVLVQVLPKPTQEDMTKKVTRTIKVNYPAKHPGNQPDQQVVTFTREDKNGNSGYVINGKTEFNGWHVIGSDKWSAYSAPTIDGYTQNITIDREKAESVADVTVDPDKTENSEVTINYDPQDQSFKVEYIDSSNPQNVVGSFNEKGKTDDLVPDHVGNDITNNMPKGWELVPNDGYVLPINFESNMSPVKVKVEHKITTTDGRKHKDDNDIYRTVTRTITVNIEGRPAQITSQKVSLYRIKKVDEALKAAGKTESEYTTYSAWTSNMSDGSTSFVAVSVPADGNGYVRSITGGTIENDKVTEQSALNNGEPAKDITVTVNYAKADQTTTVTYVDKDGNEIKMPDGQPVAGSHYEISGKTGDTVNTDVKDKVPAGWEIIPGTKYPTTVTFGSTPTSPIKVKVEHKTTKTDGRDHKDKQDLYREVTRTILMNVPNATSQGKETETLSFYRVKTVDEA
ncbi:MAG: hypothetical protein K2O64_02965, partial [Lactobacillus sp.]|nr:hypothetical protein [Lactobacillus sp.]